MSDPRTIFRKKVFERDRYLCVVPGCGLPAKDAHHIQERSSWTDPNELGGYLVDNGASVCERHHKLCERNIIPPQALRYWLNLPDRLPKSLLNTNKDYDKWGEELPRYHLRQIKYPSTYYFPFSPTCDNNTVALEDFVDVPLVGTIKMDGSNVLLMKEQVAARNGHHAMHNSFDYLKQLHIGFRARIPPYLQIFAEWLYAKHSIHYKGALAVESLLQVFAVYHMDKRLWLGWQDVQAVAKSLGLITPPVVFTGEFSHVNKVYELVNLAEGLIKQGHEGIVVKSIYPYQYSQHQRLCAKYVRKNHVQTDKHWSRQALVRNETM